MARTDGTQDDSPADGAADARGDDGSQPGRRRARTGAIIAGVAAAALLVGGGIGAAIYAATTGDDDEQPSTTQTPQDDRAEPSDASDPAASEDDGGTDGDVSPTPVGPANATGADADSLVAAIDAAVAAAEGEGATGIDVMPSGYEVEVLRTDGTTVEVLVGRDGTATVTDDIDDDHEPLLDTGSVAGIVDAAIAAAGSGTIESIDTEDGPHAYDVSVRLDDGSETEVELAEDLTVVSVERDD